MIICHYLYEANKIELRTDEKMNGIKERKCQGLMSNENKQVNIKERN